ncbi:hypothetical protein EDD18DRAFT_1347986 [Armillaria luteobubalina]|uniref:Uncharacterized protein n=1 Tax=Armillaria luteobubalina TaxID=153913 RepID=A0AA39QE00_9AGAR|nr:hypothetical protein EDD18DRAFT_1347986 [Armillaria luteobubalina]
MSNTSLSRFEQASGCLVPIINPCPEPFTPNDFTHYEYMARSYIESAENIASNRHVHALSEGFRDPLIKDWFVADMHHLCSLNVTNFLLAMRMAFLPRSWDRKLRDEIRSSYQGKDESVVEWMSRLRQTNTLLRHTYFHLSNADLLEHFKTHINTSLSAHRRYPEAAKEDDLMQWILIIKSIEESQDADGVRDPDATQCPPAIFKPTDPRLKRKRSSSNEDDVLSKRPTLSPPPSTSAPVATAPLTPTSPSAPFVSHSSKTLRTHALRIGLPCLTGEQRVWIKQRKGCFKCRRVWVYHTAYYCSNGSPDPETYQGIMEKDGTVAVDAPEHCPDVSQLLYDDEDRHWRSSVD